MPTDEQTYGEKLAWYLDAATNRADACGDALERIPEHRRDGSYNQWAADYWSGLAAVLRESQADRERLEALDKVLAEPEGLVNREDLNGEMGEVVLAYTTSVSLETVSGADIFAALDALINERAGSHADN